jgi:death-on-curing protein
LDPNLPSKAAALLESLSRNLGFLDGNKRTAVMTFWEFLAANGYRADLSDQVLFDTIIGLVNGTVTYSEVTELFEKVLKPLET